MNKLIIAAAIIALIYIFALSPQNKTKVNTAASDAAQKIGEFAMEKIRNSSKQTPTDYGRPKCTSNNDCTQFGSNITCNETIGNCIG